MKVQAKLLLRNAKMIEARNALGLTQIECAKALGIGVWHWRMLEKFDFCKKRSYEMAVKAADFLCIPVDDILPEDLRGKKVDSTIVRYADVTPLQLASVQDRAMQYLPNLSEGIEIEELKEKIDSVIHTLSERERIIITKQYGLDCEEMSQTAIAKEMGVCHERIRQIEQRAMTKLMHPERKKILANVI